MSTTLHGSRYIDDVPKLSNIKLHSHDHFELYVYLQGDTDYIVEGTRYSLQPYDIIVIRPNEMHRAFHNSLCRYDRIVFWIEPEFFDQHNCEEYRSVFMNRELGTRNKISAEFVHSSGLGKTILKWLEYTENGEYSDTAISNAVFIEILHILNKINPHYEESNSNSNLVRRVIAYINKNYAEKILLENLADEFFVSKYYLCRIFKQATGHTIITYINNRRIDRTKELCKAGMNITVACTEAGFASYSAYYKAYTKEYGTSPKSGMKNN